jgi:hypothetical protein
MHRDAYETWLSSEQTALTHEKRATMMSELDTTIAQQQQERRIKPRPAHYGSRTQRLIEQRISDVESSSDLVRFSFSFCQSLFFK